MRDYPSKNPERGKHDACFRMSKRDRGRGRVRGEKPGDAKHTDKREQGGDEVLKLLRETGKIFERSHAASLITSLWDVKLCPIMAMRSCTPSPSPRYRNRETRNFRGGVLSMNADKWMDGWMDAPGYG